MSSAQRDLQPLDEAIEQTEAEAPFALKEQVAARLAAHRARRTQRPASAVTPIAPPTPPKASTARIAAVVAERYANSQSYRAFLAAEAESAIRKAEAEADVAALNAHAVANAQYQLLAELDQWALTTPVAESPTLDRATSTDLMIETDTGVSSAPVDMTTPAAASFPAHAVSADPKITVKLYEEMSRATSHGNAVPVGRDFLEESGNAAGDEAERLALDEEIEFRQSPVFEDFIGAPVEIAANLIEFPRQLVAPRKARPRLAEGPLREDAVSGRLSPEVAQLRIFEVEPVQISTAPVVESVEPEWSSILLAAHPVAAPVESSESHFDPVVSPQAAPLSLRLMAGLVDGCLVGASLLLFAAGAALTVGTLSKTLSAPMMTLPVAAVCGGMAFCVLAALYHLLFFTFSEATPGMRYARIGLCTLSDDNPSRSAMRRRLFAILLSACPLGIGFLWACLDEDGLGWHDRISRMYQRSY